jgi:membrane-associated phospholipid phosphatase
LHCTAFLRNSILLLFTMKNLIPALLFLVYFTTDAFAQTENNFPTPYHTNLAVDTPFIAGCLALNGLGLYLMHDKEKITDEELAGISKNDVIPFDRFSAGNYNPTASTLSNIPFFISLAAPLAFLADKNIRHNGEQVCILYFETMAVTGTFYTMSVGLVDRTRPFVYKTDDPGNEELQNERHRKQARNSFFSGHISATATACFFTAKVFHDFNPDLKWEPLVWGAAAAIPLFVSYLRLQAGQHFLSDCITGYAIGAGIGILVPQLHKKGKMIGVSIAPVMGPYKGMTATVTF